MPAPAFITINGALPAKLIADVRQFVDSFPPPEFDEYTHRFEPKLMLKKKHYGTRPLLHALDFLRSPETVQFFSTVFDLHGIRPARNYFTALYVYRPGDYLQTHIDAAINEGERKVLTANLYLSDEDCEGGELRIGEHLFPARENTLVVFVNHDGSTHGVERVQRGRRIVLTAGYSLPVDDCPVFNFTRDNTKAWFVPGPGEKWGPEDFEARDERASPGWRPAT